MNNLTFSDYVTEIGQKIQKTDTNYKTQIQNFLNQNYERLWNKYLWRQAIVIDEAVTTTASSEFLYLPKTVDKIIVLTDQANDVVLVPYDAHILMRKYLDQITNASFAKRYTYAGEYGVKNQPSASAVIQVLSSTADTATIRIWGISSSEEITELLTLNGTTAVSSTASFTALSRVAKNATTTGTVTVRQITNNRELATLAPSEKVVRYIRIRLHDIPDSADTLYLTYKKRFKRLVNDQDIIEIPVLPMLTDLTTADCLREQRQYQKAEALEARAARDLQEFITQEEMQSDSNAVSMPEVHRAADDVPLYQEG